MADNTVCGSSIERQLTLAVSPSGRLRLLESPDGAPLDPAPAAAIAAAFTRGTAAGLFHLGAVEVSTQLPPALGFFRDFARLFVARLCGIGDLEERGAQVDVPAPTSELDRLAGEAPPLAGAEYVDAARLGTWWAELGAFFREEIGRHRGSVQSYLQAKNPVWNLVGRVYFHLAENKQDGDRPFAFLATYTTRLSDQARPQHQEIRTGARHRRHVHWLRVSAPRRATMEKGDRLEARIEAQFREWAAELESVKAKADKAVAEARKDYYEHVDELRKEIEAKLRTWSKVVEASQAKAESGEPAAKTLIERLHGRIQAELRELRPLIEDLRGRAEQAEQEARRLAKVWRAKREPARAALGELRAGVEKAWGELKAALDSAITKFREPS